MKENIVETKYLEKYAKLLGPKIYYHLLNKYESADYVYEPIRNHLTEEQQDDLYKKLDQSDLSSPIQKFEAIVALMMVFDGAIPEKPEVERLGKILGEEFASTVEKKREEFGTEIAVSKVRKLIDFYGDYYKEFGNKKSPRFYKLVSRTFRVERIPDSMIAY